MSTPEIVRFYEWWNELVPADLAFFNHGFTRAPAPDAVVAGSWPAVQERSALLVHEVFAGVDVDGRDVLDVGCGRGGVAAYLVAMTGVRSVTGVDIAPANVAACARLVRDPRCTFIQGDACALPVGDGAFDVVSSIESMSLYAGLDLFAAEAARVLRADGWLLAADALPQAVDAALPDVLAAAGFELVEWRDVSDEVATALELDEARQRQLISASPTVPPGLVGELIQRVNIRPRAAYRTRERVYRLFKARAVRRPA